MIASERATAFYWEFMYLNRYLVRSTQAVLDSLVQIDPPRTIRHIDAQLMPFVTDPKEREAIYGALQNHHLVDIPNEGLVTVTPKGREYQKWRGPLTDLPPSKLPPPESSNP